MTTKNKDLYGFRFRDWDIYKDAVKFRNYINGLCKKFPDEEKFSLTSQTKMACNSILLNIAEGANKNSDKDMRLYINRAQTSLDEVVACLDCAIEDEYINKTEHEESLSRASELAKQLRGFSKHLASATG